MKRCILYFLAFFGLATCVFSQVPDSHPAKQMRMFYADVYTGSNILEYRAETLDSILFVVSKFIEPAQVISVYSYKTDPYKFRRSNIYGLTQKTTTDNLSVYPQALEKTTYGYSGISGFYFDFPPHKEQPTIRPFTCYNPRRPRQDNSN